MNILDQKWLSTKQVADYLDIGYTTVRLWTSKGYFPSYRLGDGEKSTIRFKNTDILEFIENSRRPVKY